MTDIQIIKGPSVSAGGAPIIVYSITLASGAVMTNPAAFGEDEEKVIAERVPLPPYPLARRG